MLTNRELCLSSYWLIPMLLAIIIIHCKEVLCKSMTYECDKRAISIKMKVKYVGKTLESKKHHCWIRNDLQNRNNEKKLKLRSLYSDRFPVSLYYFTLNELNHRVCVISSIFEKKNRVAYWKVHSLGIFKVEAMATYDGKHLFIIWGFGLLYLKDFSINQETTCADHFG